MSNLAHDKEILRPLAGAVAEMAALPIQQERIRLWTALNDLRPERPMLWITEIPWGEFESGVDELRIECRDQRCRDIEHGLRQKLFKARNFTTDEVIRGVYEMGKVIHGTDYGLPTREKQIEQGASYIVSHHYEPVITDFPDIEKIRMPAVRHDAEATARNAEFVDGLFGDLLPVESAGARQHFFNAWDMLVRWTGVTEALMALVDRPDFIHAIMRRMTDSFLARMDQLAALNLLSDARVLQRVGSGAAGYTTGLPQADADPAHLRTTDQWGGATPQIFSDVSPAMHEEFALRYENEIMARCGLNYYGCCEPVHDKMGILADVPRLRKISISPWCNVAKAAADARRTYVFSHKPSPAILAEDRFDAGRAERDLRERLQRSESMPCEFIMKDISTVRGDVQRVIAWCKLAHRVVQGN